MELSRDSIPVHPGRRFARAEFDRWFGRYFLLAALVFAVGTALGVAAFSVTDLTSLAEGVEGLDPVFPEQITFGFVAMNNLRVLAILVLGFVSFGAISGLVLLFNGFVVGLVVGSAASDGQLVEAIALIVPHGVFELGAFFLVGGMTFRLTHRLLNYLRGVDDSVVTRQELFEIVLLVALSAGAIVIAAWIETNLTEAVARAVLGLN